jgi:hypothetical protein
MRPSGCSTSRSAKFESDGDDAISPWKRLKSSPRSARDPDSLDMVERVMEEEERQRSSGISQSPDWLELANVLLAVILALFLLFAWQVRR